MAYSARDINTTHSTWLNTSVWMSAAPLVNGNKSTRFHQNKSAGLLPSSQPYLSGECMGIPIASTLPVLEPVLSFAMSGYRFDDSMLDHILQKV